MSAAARKMVDPQRDLLAQMHNFLQLLVVGDTTDSATYRAFLLEERTRLLQECKVKLGLVPDTTQHLPPATVFDLLRRASQGSDATTNL